MAVSIRSVSLEQLCQISLAMDPGQQAHLDLLISSMEEQPRATHAFVLERASMTLGTICAVEMPGDFAVVFPPVLADDAQPHDAALLVRRLNAALDEAAAVSLAQCLVEDITCDAAAAMRAEQYQPLATISLMFCLERHFPARRPTSELDFVPVADAHARLENILENTYHDSLDCPELGRLRTRRQLLEGYRATGTGHAELWKIVRWENLDVGCLIMADHPDQEAGYLQLIYLGLLPEYRGRGWSPHLIRHAQWCAREAGQDRVLLSVDIRNKPALKRYVECGFVQMAARNLLVRGNPNVVSG